MSELWAQLKPQLEMFSRPFPHAAIELANAHRDEVAPYLVACLAAVAADPSATTQNREYMLHLYAMHLLASWRDTRAYRPLVDLGHHPEDVIEDLMGDVVTENGGCAALIHPTALAGMTQFVGWISVAHPPRYSPC